MLVNVLMIALFVTGLLSVAKRRPRKRRFNLRRVRVTTEQALATLGTDTALVASSSGASDGTYRAVTMKMTWLLSSMTQGEGPITVGYAHSDYTVTEIKECLEANAAVSIGDKGAQERANRLVRVVGTLRGDPNGSSLNDSKPISTKLNWLINIGKQVNIFMYNESQSSLTTGAFLNVAGNMWIRDSS